MAEAAINELGEWFEFNRRRPPFKVPYGLPEGFYDMELRTKWSLLPIFLLQRSFDRGAEPWQSFEILVELRNYIVHLRRRSASTKTKGFLKARFDGELSFEAAEWACDTIAKMFDKLTELVNPPAHEIGLT